MFDELEFVHLLLCLVRLLLFFENLSRSFKLLVFNHLFFALITGFLSDIRFDSRRGRWTYAYLAPVSRRVPIDESLGNV